MAHGNVARLKQLFERKPLKDHEIKEAMEIICVLLQDEFNGVKDMIGETFKYDRDHLRHLFLEISLGKRFNEDTSYTEDAACKDAASLASDEPYNDNIESIFPKIFANRSFAQIKMINEKFNNNIKEENEEGKDTPWERIKKFLGIEGKPETLAAYIDTKFVGNDKIGYQVILEYALSPPRTTVNID
jgi:hypothetical protein